MHKLTDVTGIIVSIFGVGALLAGLILTGQHGIKGEVTGIKGEINGMKVDIADLQQRAARIEGQLSSITDLQQRTARIEGQLSLLLEAWNIDQPDSPTVAGK
ncbi:MAG: hypothetical protein OXS28_09990 [Gammaproteobacteria bacterium]|nr:hypothetical protein [Gammaproteobacteria bacterium]